MRQFGIGVTALLVGLVCRLGAAEPTLAAPTAAPAVAGVSAVAAGEFKIHYPFDETVFPPDLAPPTFRWPQVTPRCDTWRITLRFRDDLAPVQVTVGEPRWTPAAPLWEAIKQRSREKPAQVTVSGSRRFAPDETVCQSSISIVTSQDEVGAPIFYRDVNLPFVEAVKDPSDIRWRFGSSRSRRHPGSC